MTCFQRNESGMDLRCWSRAVAERNCDINGAMVQGSAIGFRRIITGCVLAVGVCCGCFGQTSYDIRRATAPLIIDGKLDESDWKKAPSVGDFSFPWLTEGTKEPTVAKLLWDNKNLYVAWYASDRHISAFIRERHGPVSKDDCVEIFISPNPENVKEYFNFEINAIGTILTQAHTGWKTDSSHWEPDGMQYRTSFHGLERKDESPDDTYWIVEAAIPLKNFVREAAHTPPRDGDQWRLNLHRLGGKTNAQLSSWSPYPEGRVSFHQPEYFGWVRFVKKHP